VPDIYIDLIGLTVTHAALYCKPLFDVAISMSCNTKLKVKISILHNFIFNYIFFFGIKCYRMPAIIYSASQIKIVDVVILTSIPPCFRIGRMTQVLAPVIYRGHLPVIIISIIYDLCFSSGIKVSRESKDFILDWEQ
jgi:hypothetical protein